MGYLLELEYYAWKVRVEGRLLTGNASLRHILTANLDAHFQSGRQSRSPYVAAKALYTQSKEKEDSEKLKAA